MVQSKKTFGFVPVDVLLMGAISAGIEDLRKKPYLLDFLYNWFATDELTSKIFGEQEKQRAKDWFVNNQIHFRFAFNSDQPAFPMVSVNLVSSSEDVAILGDVNPETTEDLDIPEANITPVTILGPFIPKTYDVTTGVVVLPDDLNTSDVFEGQVLVDGTTGIGYTILKVLDNTSFAIDADVNVNFQNAYVASLDTSTSVSLESCLFRQTYSIKCLAQNEPLYVIYLGMLIRFILMRYKEQFIEGRGFLNTTMSMGPIYYAQELTGVEKTFGTDIQVSGIVREYWPKVFTTKLQGIKLAGVKVLDGGESPESVDFNAQGWGMENDPFEP